MTLPEPKRLFWILKNIKLGFFAIFQSYEIFLVSDCHKYSAKCCHQNDGDWRAEWYQQYRTNKHGKSCGKRHVFGSKKQDHHNSRCDKPHTPIDDKHRGKTDEKSFSSLKLKLKREGMTEHTKHSRVCRSKLKVNALPWQKPRKKPYDNCGFWKVKHKHPPCPLIAKSSFEICKTGISTAAFSDILMINCLGYCDCGVHSCYYVTAYRR